MSEIVIQGTTPGIRVSGTGAQVTVKVTTGSGSTGGGVWGAISGTLTDQLDLNAALNGKVSTSDQRLSDARTPTAHKASHATGGTDPLTAADIGAAPVSHAHGAADITSGVIDPARLPALPVSLVVAVGDETTALTTTNNPKVSFRMPHAMTLTSIRASLRTSSSSGKPTFDVKLNGASILSTLISVDASAKTSVGASVPAVISTASLPDDGEITIEITVAGTGAAGAKIAFVGARG